MKKLILGFLSFSFVSFVLNETSINQVKVQKAVLEWADKTFEYYDEPRFENFNAVPTDDFYKLENKIIGLSDYREEMKQMFSAGEIDKSTDEFDRLISNLNVKIDSLQSVKENYPEKYSSYEIDFWSNIKVSNGLTVYYKHHLKLDSAYTIKFAEVATSVGKSEPDLEIIYKKTGK